MAKGFPGGGMGNMQQLMQQAERMQRNVQRIQEEIHEREFTASAGGDAVRATVYGRKELKAIEIAPECVDPDDIEMLQDLVISAVNAALRLAEETMSAEMAKVTGGMNLGF